MTQEKDESTKYIYKRNNKYFLLKQVQGKQRFYGSYNTLSEAQQMRTYYQERGWLLEDITKKKKNPPGKYIHEIKRKKGTRYVVQKRIPGAHTLTYFGTYNTLEEAKKARDYLQEHNWNTELVPYTNRKRELQQKYIIEQKRVDGTSYIIQKGVNGRCKRFGTFRNLEDAMKERDLLIQCDWNVDDYYEMPIELDDELQHDKD